MPKANLQKSAASVLVRPRITEKGSFLSAKGVYCFLVLERANKHEILEAVKTIHGVTPVKIRVTKIPAKTINYRGRRGVKGGGKKAYVYLKKGDKIEFV